jgi:site-specific DNA-methyltransferase (adenine-specific)
MPMAWEIITGDCIDVMGGKEPGSARLVFADPPYNIGIDYGEHHDDRMEPADYLAWCERWIRAAARLLAPDGSLWLLVNHEWGWRLAGIAVDGVGLHLRQWLTWYESFGQSHPHPRKFARTSRPLLWLVKDPGRFIFDADAVRVRSQRQELGDKRANPAGKIPDDVWTFDRVAGTHRGRIPGFPTQLPVELLDRIVACASRPDDLVVDPFSGSGTTGRACIGLGRRFVGIEKSARFAERSRQLLANVTPRLAGLA